MKKRSTKVPLIPGTKYPVPEVTGEWMDDEPGHDQGGAGPSMTLLVVRGATENADKFRREVRHGTAFDLFTTLGAEHERGVASRRASSAPRNVAKKAALRSNIDAVQAERKAAGKPPLSEEQLAAKFKTTRKKVRSALGKST